MIFRSIIFKLLFIISTISLLAYFSSMLSWLMLVVIPVASLSVWHFYQQYNHLEVLSKQRNNLDFNDFIEDLNEPGHDPKLVQSVYKHTLRLFSEDFKRFPLLPDDGFVEDLQLDKVEVETDLICNIAQEAHVHLEHMDENPLNDSISTPRQLINWFEKQSSINNRYVVE